VIELLTSGNDDRINAARHLPAKAAYLLDLARHFESGKLKTHKFASMGDEEIIDALDGKRHRPVDGGDVSDLRAESAGCVSGG
jgi:hypothetical protein